MSKVKPKNVSKLTNDELVKIAYHLHQGVSDKDIADMMETTPATIAGLRKGVTKPDFEKEYGSFPRVTDIDVDSYERKWSAGGKDFRKLRSTTSTQDLAKLYKVSIQTIRQWIVVVTQIDEMNKGQ